MFGVDWSRWKPLFEAIRRCPPSRSGGSSSASAPASLLKVVLPILELPELKLLEEPRPGQALPSVHAPICELPCAPCSRSLLPLRRWDMAAAALCRRALDTALRTSPLPPCRRRSSSVSVVTFTVTATPLLVCLSPRALSSAGELCVRSTALLLHVMNTACRARLDGVMLPRDGLLDWHPYSTDNSVRRFDVCAPSWGWNEHSPCLSLRIPVVGGPRQRRGWRR